MNIHLPTLDTGNETIDHAFRIAVGDLVGNVVGFRAGLLNEDAPAIMAGLDYDRPWTRDTAINAWNGASLIVPDAAHNTFLAVLERGDDGRVRIGGQYWDAIIWTTGAWWHYLYTGDRDFLALALEATANSLLFFEETEFDASDNLFRGPACYGDGVSAYPDVYADAGGSSGIYDWPRANPDKRVPVGRGIPMKALSTNCLYYNAYITAGLMARELGVDVDPGWQTKADALREALRREFWMDDAGRFRYITGALGKCDYQEGLGHSFAILFGVADKEQTEAVFSNQYIAPAGIPCLWPTFPRYQSTDADSYGRQSGTVWPHVQGFWADAAAAAGRVDIFTHELKTLARSACRDAQFTEIYHPTQTTIYGGIQERKGRGITPWDSCRRQTWSATAYLRMVVMGLAGMRFSADGVRFRPCLPGVLSKVHLGGIRYRRMTLDVTVEGAGGKMTKCLVDGKAAAEAFVPADGDGPRHVVLK